MNLFDYDREQLLLRAGAMIEVCEPISNWTTGAELAWLSEAASTRYRVAEVGSYKGKSAKALAWRCPGVVHCVDRFQDGTRADFEANLATELKEGKVVLHDAESAEGAAMLAKLGLQFDLIFIDASHTQEDVVRDIRLWAPLLSMEGILCGHDCHPTDPKNGVYAALLELGIDHHNVADSIWARRPK